MQADPEDHFSDPEVQEPVSEHLTVFNVFIELCDIFQHLIDVGNIIGLEVICHLIRDIL